MKTRKNSIFLILIIGVFLIQGCELFTLDEEEVVTYEGRIFEAFDTSKPIDSVIVRGCKRSVLNFFPGPASCETETLTNSEGTFSISFEVNGLEGRGISYFKEGYINIDSCVTLNNGKLECFMKALPTYFRLISGSSSTREFDYDNVLVRYKMQTKDSMVNYTLKSLTGNNNNATYYFWSSDPSIVEPSSSNNAIYNLVLDNSTVTLQAEYSKNGNLLETEYDTIFCKKGVGNTYRINKYK